MCGVMDEFEFLLNYDCVDFLKMCIIKCGTSQYMTHSQLLEGLKCESQTENSGRTRSRGTFPNSQHWVEGHARVPGWD
jgi:hypothetical protein